MKVVHIFKDFYPPTTGGIEQHMRLLCTEMAKHLEVAVLVPSRGRRTVREDIDGVHVVRVPEFGRYASAPLCPTAPFCLRHLRPDLVHLHFPNPMGDLTYLLSGVAAQLVISYHADIIKQRAFLPAYRPVLDSLFNRAARVISASQEYVTSSELLQRYTSKITLIPYGIDLQAVRLRRGEDAEVERLRRRSGGPVVLFVGALRYYKGVDVLLRAMARVDARAWIVGRGSPGNGLMSLPYVLGIDDRVRFFGEVSDAQLRMLLHAADVFVLPSIDRCEAFGIAQLEAMACGKPVVSTDLPTGVRSVNQHERTGLVVPPRDEEALAAALNRLLADSCLRARFGAAGRQRVEREFTVERMVGRTLGVYRELMEPHAKVVAPRRAVG